MYEVVNFSSHAISCKQGNKLEWDQEPQKMTQRKGYCRGKVHKSNMKATDNSETVYCKAGQFKQYVTDINYQKVYVMKEMLRRY